VFNQGIIITYTTTNGRPHGALFGYVPKPVIHNLPSNSIIKINGQLFVFIKVIIKNTGCLVQGGGIAIVLFWIAAA
jgi:hypothetical protein